MMFEELEKIWYKQPRAVGLGPTQINLIQSVIAECMDQFLVSFHGVYSAAQYNMTIADVQKMYDRYILDLKKLINDNGNKVYKIDKE